MPADPLIAAKANRRRQILANVGGALLLLWVSWWTYSFDRPLPSLEFIRATWVPPYPPTAPFIGLDFLHNYWGGRCLFAHRDPYLALPGDFRYDRYTYPPAVLPFFIWCGLVRPDHALFVRALTDDGRLFQGPVPLSYVATLIWTLVAAAAVASATWTVAKGRESLHLTYVPPILLVSLVLFSAPVIFELERGNCDVLVLLLILAAADALRGRHWANDVLAAFCLAVAAWLKLYPAVTLLGLFALSRNRAGIFALLFAALIGLIPLHYTLEWVQVVAGRLNQPYDHFDRWAHSLSAGWQTLCLALHADALAKIPALPAAAFLLGIPAAVVSRRVYRSDRHPQIIIAYLLWLTALATFGQWVSWDYNLIFLPIAAAAIWDHRAPRWMQLIFWAAALTVLQPFNIPTWGVLLFALKLAGTIAVGLMIARRCQPAAVLPATKLAPTFF